MKSLPKTAENNLKIRADSPGQSRRKQSADRKTFPELECYLAMDSIREYLLVKEDEMRVEHYAKQNLKQWIYRIYNDREEIISLESINCKISVTEIYAQIDSEVAGKKAGA